MFLLFKDIGKPLGCCSIHTLLVKENKTLLHTKTTLSKTYCPLHTTLNIKAQQSSTTVVYSFNEEEYRHMSTYCTLFKIMHAFIV